jgi:hypothetical protein
MYSIIWWHAWEDIIYTLPFKLKKIQYAIANHQWTTLTWNWLALELQWREMIILCVEYFIPAVRNFMVTLLWGHVFNCFHSRYTASMLSVFCNKIWQVLMFYLFREYVTSVMGLILQCTVVMPNATCCNTLPAEFVCAFHTVYIVNSINSASLEIVFFLMCGN